MSKLHPPRRGLQLTGTFTELGKACRTLRSEAIRLLNGYLQASDRHSMAAEASATPQEWMDDLALMRHFVKWTTKEPFGAREEVQYLWQEVVTDMALEHPFLMVRIVRRTTLLHIALGLSRLALSVEVLSDVSEQS